MATLRQLMNIVEEELHKKPNVAEWRASLRLKLNQVNRSFCGDNERRWPWMVRRVPLPVYPDFELPLGVGGVTRKIGWGNRTLDLPLADLVGTMYPAETASAWREHHMALAKGAEVELASRTLDPVPGATLYGNWSHAPFTIEHALPTSGIAPSSALVTIQLDPRAEIPALSGDEGNLAVRFTRYKLPADCSVFIALRDEAGRRLRPLNSQELSLSEPDRLRISTPCYAVEDSNADFRYPISAWPGLADDTGAYAPHTPYLFQNETWPVEERITLENVVDGGSTLATGTTYRVILSWHWSGRYGPPSTPAAIVGIAGNLIRVSGFKLPPTTGAQFEFGRRLSVWMAAGEDGAYMLKGFITDPSATTYDIIASNAAPADARLRLPRFDEHFYDGLPKYIRLYPRPSEFKRYELEYRVFPRELIQDTDSPQIDGPHEVIAWLAAAELVASNGGDPSTAHAMYERELRKLLAKAGQSESVAKRFGSVDGRGWDRDSFLHRFINADDLDWNG